MAEIPLIVLFGPSPSSYLVAAGLKFHAENMPPSLTSKLFSRDLPIRRVLWASIDKTGKWWCAENFASGSVHFEVPPGSGVHRQILENGAQYLTWPDYDEVTATGESGGHWNVKLPSFYINTIGVLRNAIPNFDLGLKYVIFGKGGTHIYQFETGFLASLEGEHEQEDHPLNQALRQFDPSMEPSVPQGLWKIDKGSSLSLANGRHFFIRFINTQTQTPEYRFCLPPVMDSKLRELLKLAQAPEQQQALRAEEQAIIVSHTPMATTKVQDVLLVGFGAVGAMCEHPSTKKHRCILEPLLSVPYANVHPQPTYVLLQNGLHVEADLYQAIKQLGKEPSIISTALYINTNLLEPNVVEHGIVDRLSIGIYRHNDFTTETNTPAEAAVLEDISAILTAGGGDISICAEVQRKKFSKNFWNVAFSSFSTLTGYRLPALFRPPPSDPSAPYTPYVSPTTAHLIKNYTIPTIRATLQELVVLARALGYPDSNDGIPSTLPDEVIENTRQLHIGPDSSHKPSMLLDAEKGQAIEVEAILGSVVRLAQERGVSVPRVEMLYALLLVVQNQLLAKLEA
ncbi:hypothetical protein H0H87_001499 [Tephrocybe sp. NHM501043]|nr:hypothetical protein H0H87_001499 [Tephrocybe sp. NHM501043]